jgi:excisionase family DNA binding protein
MRKAYLATQKESKGILRGMKATQRNLLNTEEFAAALGLSPKTVRQWTWTRRVSFVRVGRAIRFRPETVDEIVNRGSVPAVETRQ